MPSPSNSWLWWLIIPLVFLFYGLKRHLRRQQRRLRDQPSGWQSFIAETKRLRRQSRGGERRADSSNSEGLS